VKDSSFFVIGKGPPLVDFSEVLRQIEHTRHGEISLEVEEVDAAAAAAAGVNRFVIKRILLPAFLLQKYGQIFCAYFYRVI
jgi:hypothetical protein